MKSKIKDPIEDFEINVPDEIHDKVLTETVTAPTIKWAIDADIDSALKKEGVDLLNSGVKTRKVAIH